jgi:SAM-dependent methyltransferase
MSVEPEAIRAFEHAGWQRAAAVYTDSFAHATAPFIKPLLEVAAFSPGQHVLDVACGPGHLAAAAAARGAAAHGLDFSAAMVGVARKTHPEIVVIEGDAEDLPYPDSMFPCCRIQFWYEPRTTAAGRACRVQARAETWWAGSFHGMGYTRCQYCLVTRVRRGRPARQSVSHGCSPARSAWPARAMPARPRSNGFYGLLC